MTISKHDPTLKYEFQIHHLLVMSNHYHLIISVSTKTPINVIMQQINSMVARAMNKALGRTGHFWGGRYKSQILNTFEYLRETIAYIYENPVRAGMLKDPFKYLRSTLQYYCRQILPPWLSPDPILKEIRPQFWPNVFFEMLRRA